MYTFSTVVDMVAVSSNQLGLSVYPLILSGNNLKIASRIPQSTVGYLLFVGTERITILRVQEPKKGVEVG